MPVVDMDERFSSKVMQVVEFRALIEDASEGSFTARLVPFGEPAPHNGGTVEFRRGGLTANLPVPLTVDHADGVLDRVGVLTGFTETDTGAYGMFQLSDTEQGRDLRTLMLDGAVTDVSVGVRVTDETDGVMSGTLDHVSLVSHGRFNSEGIRNPSEVLSVHSQSEGAEMPENTETVTTEVVTYDDTDMKAEIVRLSDTIDTMQNRVVDEPDLFESVGDFVKTQTLAAHGDDDASRKMEKFALNEETTTTAAGVVPDFLSSEILTILATSRAFVGNIPSDPIGDSGMTVVYPEVTAKGTVAKQATENLEVASGAVTVGVNSTDLFTYAGANKVSQQLIMRSAPSYVQVLLDELAGQYMEVTNADSIATAVAAADGTAILADLGADAAVTFAAFNVASSAIIAGVRRPADTVFLASDRWTQLNSLVDAAGRPLLVFPQNGPQNAQGQSGFDVSVAQYHGWIVRLDVDAAAGTCLIASTPKSVANLEMSPAQLSALQVSTISTDIGIWGLQNVAVKFDTGLYTLTAA